MFGAVSGALAYLRLRLPKLPRGRLFNASGHAGPRRLAVAALIALVTLTIIVVVLISGRTVPAVSQDARLKPIDPLPGGLKSTPEQDALAMVVTDQQAAAALHQGASYTPAMAPSQPAQPLPPPDVPAPRPEIVAQGRPARPAPVATPVVPPHALPAAASNPAPAAAPAPAPHLRPPRTATTPSNSLVRRVNAQQINDLFSQWGGRVPRTDIVLPSAPGFNDPDGTSAGARMTTRASLPAATSAADQSRILIPAGRGVYAHPVLALSSDQTSPAVFQADSGPIAGDRLTGTFSRQANRLIIHVTGILHQGEEIICDGVVIAPDTMEASVASKVDEHYVSRILLPAAAAFVQGLGAAIQQTSNSAAVISPFGGTTTTTHLNFQQQLGVAAGAAAQQIGSVINQEAPKGPTISLEANVAVGIIFLSNVVTHRS